MKAERTPSGKWRCRPVDHYEVVGGKRKAVKASITRKTKKEALEAAYAFLADKERRRGGGLTVAECIEGYINAKAAVLSPSTLRSYRCLQRNAYAAIADLTTQELVQERLQSWVSQYSAEHSPKAVRNAYGLLTASLRQYSPVTVSATLPQKKPPELYTPTDADIKKLLRVVVGTDLEKAILLAAVGTLRRGEVCGLMYEDIEGNVLHVRRSMVEAGGGETVLKAPKTPQSIRAIVLPPAVLKCVLRDSATSGRVVRMSPTALSNAFAKAVKKAGLPPFRFHDLRAYSASVRHALGIPDQYIMQDGGWKSDAVLKAIYRRTLADKSDHFTAVANEHFDNVFG